MTQQAMNAINNFKSGVKGAFAKHIQRKTTFDPLNSKIFEDAVTAAYGDAKRTFKGINGRATTANSNLAQKIQTYFKAPAIPMNFDKLHNDWCKEYIADLKNQGYDKTTYGQSQKVVNMTFKYLYCLDGATSQPYDTYFDYCHVALDSNTLEWIWRNCGLDDNEKHDDWSKIKYNNCSTRKTTKLGYAEIVKRYRDNKSSYYPNTPFQAEFIFWEEIKAHLAAEAFYSSLPGAIDTDTFKNMSLKQKYTAIKKLI